jgi:WD40 repeat protein
MAASPDGRHFATGGDDGTIRVWDALEGKLVQVFVGHEGMIYDVAWSPDGEWIASTTTLPHDGVRIWNSQTGQLQNRLPIIAGSLAWLQRDGNIWLTTGEPYMVRLWTVDSPDPVREISMPIPANWIAWSPDASSLAAASSKLYVWDDVRSVVRLEQSLEDNAPAFMSLAWSPDGATLATGHTDGFVRLWNCETGEFTAFDAADQAPDLAWPAEPNLLLVAGAGGAFAVDEVAEDGSRPRRYGFSTQSVACSLKGDWVAISNDGAIQVLNVESGQMLYTLPGRKVGIADLALDREHDRLAFSVNDWQRHQQASVHALDLQTWRIAGILARNDGSRYAGYPYAGLAFSPDSRWLAAAPANSGVLEVWDTTQQRLGLSVDLPAATWQPAWSPDSQLLAVYAADGVLLIWDIAEQRELWRSEPFSSTPHEINLTRTSLSWSPNSQELAVNGLGGKPFGIWDRMTGQLREDIGTFGVDSVSCLAWHPREEWLAISERERRELRFWDMATARERLIDPVPYISGPEAVSWAPGTSDAVTWSVDQTVRVVSGENGEILREFIVPGNFQKWLDDGLAMMDAGGGMQIWDLSSAARTGTVFAVSMTCTLFVGPDGHYASSRPPRSDELIYVVKTVHGQRWMSPEEFAAEFGWRNDPAQVTLLGETKEGP